MFRYLIQDDRRDGKIVAYVTETSMQKARDRYIRDSGRNPDDMSLWVIYVGTSNSLFATTEFTEESKDVSEFLNTGMIVRFSDDYDEDRIVKVTEVNPTGFRFEGGYRGWKTINSMDILTPSKVI